MKIEAPRVSQYLVPAALEAVTDVHYEHPESLDQEMVAQYCSAVIEAVGEQIDISLIEPISEDDDREETWRAEVLRESFVRVFEAGVRVGREMADELPDTQVVEEVPEGKIAVLLDKEVAAGLVQLALRDLLATKE